MSIDSLLDEYADKYNWDDSVKLAICVSYIEAQQSNEAFENHIQEYVSDEE